MKKIIKTATCLIVLGMVTVQAQTPPPTPPKTPSIMISYSETAHDSRLQTTKTSVSISDSDDSYSFRAKFSSQRFNDVKELLENEMNKKNYSFEKGKHQWKLETNNQEIYEVSLSKTRLNMFLDKDLASDNLAEKFKNLGLTLRSVISGKDPNEDAIERQKREADKLTRDAQRMLREAERLNKLSENDAKAIADYAKHLADKAKNESAELHHLGGVTELVETLLNDDKTAVNYNIVTQSSWRFYQLQKELVKLLKTLQLIGSENEFNLVKDDTGMYASGKRLTTIQETRIKRLFNEHKMLNTNDFSFYKKGNHIVVINSDANIKGFLRAAKDKGLITSTTKPVKLVINGYSAFKDGQKFSKDQLDTLNKLLTNHNIIPAPGKTLEVMKNGYKLGYTVNDKMHYGTWEMNY
jgi:hypothetical protein